MAGIRQVIPAKHAFGADGQVVTIGRNELEEVFEIVVADVRMDELFAVPVHHADTSDLAGMEVDSAVELGGGRVVPPWRSCRGGAARPRFIRLSYAGEVQPTLPRPEFMLTKNQKGFEGSIKSPEPPLALSVPLSRFTSRIGGGYI